MPRPLLSPAVCLILSLLAPAAPADEGAAERTGEVIRTRQALADRPAAAVHVDLAGEGDPGQALPPVLAAPNLRTLVVAGPRFEDRHFERLAAIPTLETLVLDCTEVSEKAVAKVRRERPELTILRSQRWAIAGLPAASLTVDNSRPRFRALLGDPLFQQAGEVSYRYLTDLEDPDFGKPVPSSELAPIKYLTTVEDAFLTYTEIDDKRMQYLAGLKNLERLWLPPRGVTGAGLAHIRGLTNLEVYSGPLDDEGAEHLGTLGRLESLFIDAGPKLTDAGLKPLGRLSRLETLLVKGSAVGGAGLSHLAGLDQLQHLKLGPGVRDLSSLPMIRRLIGLEVAAKLDAAAMAPLARCENLLSLGLVSCELSDAGVTYLKDLSSLRDLSLRGSNVTDAGARHLETLSRLRNLNLAETGVSGAMAERLRKALPDCRVAWWPRSNDE